MKGKRLLIFALLLPALLLSGCGNVLQAEKIIGASSVYTVREISSAMNRVMLYFALHTDGWKLLEISYTEDPEDPPENDQTIRLYSIFETGPRTEGSLSPNETYSRYSWELTRGPLGSWKLTNWGYG